MQTTIAPTLFHRAQTTVLALLILVLFASVPARAATTLYWPAGNGTWTAGVANWGAVSGGPFNVAWNNANNDLASFNNSGIGNPYTATLGSDVTVGGLGGWFQSQVTIAPDAGGSYKLTMDGTGTTANPGNQGFLIDAPVVLAQTQEWRGGITVNGNMSGSGNLSHAATGTLTLNGDNSARTGTTSSSLTLVIGHDNALGSGNL